MEGQILIGHKLGKCEGLYENQVNERQQPLDLSVRLQDSSYSEQYYNHANGLHRFSNKDDSSNLLCISDDDSSIFETELIKGLPLIYVPVNSTSKLKQIKEVLSEVKAKYVDWKISELLLSVYKTASSDLPPHTAKKVEDIIVSCSVLPFKSLKNRRCENFNLLGLEEDDFLSLSTKPLLGSEKKELTSKVMLSLNNNIQMTIKEKEMLKGVFGSHCLKVTPADSAVSVERGQQAQVNDQVKLQLDHGYELLMSANDMMHQLTRLEVNTVQRLQNASYLSLKEKATYVCNSICVLKHKMDQMSLADVNHTRSMNKAGEVLKMSVDSLSEKRKSLLKILEKYERKEKASKQFRDIVAEYARTKRLLHHKLQTLKVLNEPDDSFS